MNTELYIEGLIVDISADISNLLTFAIDDVKEFASRQTTFSKTIVLPGTASNNKLFAAIFETGISNNYNPALPNISANFNASKSAACVLFQDFMQTFKGTIRLLQINIDNGRKEYEVALNGELTNLSVSLSSKFLKDLDFSAYDHIYNETNIFASWNNIETGYYYPLADYGNYSMLKHDWAIGTFRPALFVKEYLDKIFAAANYRYTCDLFQTTRFKKLIIPHNQKQLTALNTRAITKASNSSSFVVSNTESSVQVDILINGVSVKSQTVYYTGSTNITTTTGINPGDTLRVTITGQFVTSVTFNGGGSIGAFTTTDDITYTYAGASSTILDISFLLNLLPAIPRSIVPGETLTYTSSIIADSTANIPVLVSYGDAVKLNDAIPQNIRQVDFLTSIVKLFNLYVYEDRFDDRLIKITPFVDFYSTDSGNAVDWTYKLNRDKMITVKPMSEINSKTYDFNYKEDSDYWNDLYKKRYNQGYGSYSFDSKFEFTSAKNKLELIFSGTPLVGYASEDKVYSTIYKRTGTGSGIKEEQTDSVIRILQTKKITGVVSWDIKDGVTTVASTTNYGYAGHFDNPDFPQNDLNFGVTKELFFTLITGNLTRTQFNLYWSSYMAEITDKDSKMLTGYFYLTPKDIFDLDFSKYIHLDGVLFRINKIIDYNTTHPSDCQCQLLRVLNTLY